MTFNAFVQNANWLHRTATVASAATSYAVKVEKMEQVLRCQGWTAFRQAVDRKSKAQRLAAHRNFMRSIKKLFFRALVHYYNSKRYIRHVACNYVQRYGPCLLLMLMNAWAK